MPDRFLVTLAAAVLVAGNPIVMTAQIPPLKDTAWVLVWLPAQRVIGGGTTIRFEADRATGSDGCNRFTADYATAGNELHIGPRSGSTQMACPDPVAAQAMVFINTLARTRSYRMEAGQLQLLGDDGRVLAILAPQPLTLADTAWQVTGYNNGTQAVTSVLGGTAMTMRFGTDGRVSGSAGCNTYNGPYTAEGTTLRFGPAATTRKACAAPARVMEQEQQFLEAVATVAVARMEGDRLELRTADGAIAVTLRRDQAKP